jgi:hypothetical protein
VTSFSSSSSWRKDGRVMRKASRRPLIYKILVCAPCLRHRCVISTIHITKWCSMILVSQLLCFVKISFPVKHLMPYMLEVAVLTPNHLTLWRTLVSFALCIEGMCFFSALHFLCMYLTKIFI